MNFSNNELKEHLPSKEPFLNYLEDEKFSTLQNFHTKPNAVGIYRSQNPNIEKLLACLVHKGFSRWHSPRELDQARSVLEPKCNKSVNTFLLQHLHDDETRLTCSILMAASP